MFLVWRATTKQKRRRWLGRSHFIYSIGKCHCCCRILGSFIWGSEVMDTRVQALSEFFLFVRCRVGGIITLMIWQAIQRDTYCEVCGPFAFQYLIMFNHVTSREIREAGNNIQRRTQYQFLCMHLGGFHLLAKSYPLHPISPDK